MVACVEPFVERLLGRLVQRELCVAIALSDFAACEDAASNEKAEVHHAGR